MKYYEESLFSVTPMVYPLLVIALTLGGYYYIFTHDLFPEWSLYIYYGEKILLLLLIILGSLRSAIMPMFVFLSGLLIYCNIQLYNKAIPFVSAADGSQLMIAAFAAFLIMVILR